jgi:hypothetical protein
LDEFRQRVSGEVRQINILFPEYTPHDEQYHLKRLFHVADTVLGRDRIEAMNSAELFVLAVALYGHDWGMAISESEKEYIITGKPPEGMSITDLWILSDEKHRFTKFARDQRLSMNADGHVKEIPIEMWREYVRQTHAFRSGERVRRFFDPIDPGIADASSRICIGHWLNFEDLEDYRSYPPDFSVLRETVNLRALAVYLRLIDLLDLADDRTPYVIWKFVAPRDPRSKMEWAKHRALRPVTCPPYQVGRIIRVDGSTDDHEVYAALEDLRIWCGDQLRGCNDLLARMNDPRHKLDLYHIDWRVAPRGFNPVSIQFEFDRERMFEILSDEIYQGDPYVFLRELLQNSIDAIRMRREVLQRRDIDPGNLGVIRVTVEHGTGGDAIVTWQDDGIGMDEYIVRNYLAVAGKSYYTSSDFEREGLKMDPISRFGVGILSCFMVTDRLEIETFKEPYLPPTRNPIRITIPAVRRQFRIETLPQEGAQVGTTVCVFVEGKKISADEQGKPVEQLDVTRYLSIIAGFVEFPIVIQEGDRKTIVLHPKQAPNTARQRFGKEFQIHQLDLSYPWDKAILPQDMPTAREFLREQRWDIASDLGLEDYDGVLSYLVPVNDRADLRYVGPSAAEVIIRREPGNTREKVRHYETWSLYDSTETIGVSRTGRHSSSYTVYRDGILVPTTSVPILPEEHLYIRSLPVPRIVVNLPKRKAPRVDLARTQLHDQSEHWAAPVFQAHLHRLFEISIKDLLSKDPAERWYQLGRLIAFHNIDPENLWQVFPQEHWPLPFLEAGGRLNFLEWQEIASIPIYQFPDILSYEINRMSQCLLLTQDKYEGFLFQWAGERSVVDVYGGSAALRIAANLWQIPVNKSHCFAAIRFLHPPWESNLPLFQKIWLPIDVPRELPSIGPVLEKASRNPTLLNAFEREVLLERLRRSIYYKFPEIIEFPTPFSESFAYGFYLLNLKHPITQCLLRFLATFELLKNCRILPEDKVGGLEDSLKFLWGGGRDLKFEDFSNHLCRIWVLAHDLQLFCVNKVEDLIPKKEEFVPETFDLLRIEETGGLNLVIEELLARGDNRSFGQPLSDVSIC